MNIPTDKEIIALYYEFHTPPHVREHCGMVAHACEILTKKFEAKGIKINWPLLKAAALLHDLVRVVDFRTFDPKKFPFKPSEDDVKFWIGLREKYTGRHHAEVGAEILEKKGYHEVADLVSKHYFLQIEKGFTMWEEKILYYCDKRVKHHQIVTLKERLEEGKQRNVPHLLESESSKLLDEKVFALEKEISNSLDKFDPLTASDIL